MTRYLTVTPAASRCLCAAEPLLQEACWHHAVPHLDPRYLSAL